MIVCGLYAVLWGKAKEIKEKTRLVPTPTADNESDETKEVDQNENENKEKAEAVLQITVQP